MLIQLIGTIEFYLTITSDITLLHCFGSCETDGSCPDLGVSGCTDATANNYDASATTDDGSCTYDVTLTVDMNCSGLTPGAVAATGPSDGWSCGTYALSDGDGDGVWEGTFSLAAGSFEYIYCTDGWAQQETAGLIAEMQAGGTCAPVTDYANYANRLITVGAITTVDTWGSCSACVPGASGCTDPAADNYDANATTDDGSCTYPPSILTITTTVCDGATSVQMTGPWWGWDPWAGPVAVDNGNGTWTFTLNPAPTADMEYLLVVDGVQEDLVAAGTASGDWSCTPVTDYWSYANRLWVVGSGDMSNVYGTCGACASVVSGCTDPAADNYDATATVDDGSCTYPPTTCAEDAPTGLGATNVIQNRATIVWDNMNSALCLVDQYRIKYSGDGGATWTQKTMGQPVGSCAWACNKVEKLILNLTPSTTYEYQMKAWYCGGSSSAWTAMETFTTSDDCPNVGNLAVSSGSPTQATFTWDDSNGAYSFMRIKARVDTTGAAWFNVGGSGVAYGTFTKNKNGLAAGESYRGQSRTWCDPNGGAYKSPTWTALLYWTQPTSSRIEGGSAIANLDVYPNPSRDIFNVSFTSEDIQDLEVRVINVVGEVVYTENLEEFVGEYTKQVDLATYTKGVYFLEITTDNGVVNKKLLIQ